MEQTFTKENFKEVLSCGKPVVVDFWATWCGPCRMLAPVVEEVAQELDGKVCVCKCNVDEQEDLAIEYGIRNIPTLIYFKDGQPADRTVGVLSKQEIFEHINKL